MSCKIESVSDMSPLVFNRACTRGGTEDRGKQERRIETHKGSCRPTEIEEYASKASPQPSKDPHYPQYKSREHTWRHQIPERFRAEKARKGISFHGLEDVVLGRVEDFRVVSVVIFNGGDDVVENALWEDDFSLGACQEVCVQYFFSAGSQVRARDLVCR